MKTIFNIFLIFAIFVLPFESSAKRFGGGKYRNNRYKKTTPYQQKNQTVNKKEKSGGFFKGLLGGLIAGGLIASLMSFFDFGDMGFMKILLLAGIMFALFKIFKIFVKNKARPRTLKGAHFSNNKPSHKDIYTSQTSNYQNTQPLQASTAPDLNPEEERYANQATLPYDFDKNKFTEEAIKYFYLLQKAWNDKDFNTISEYVHDSLKEEMQEDMQQDNDKTEILYVTAKIVGADFNNKNESISVHFSGSSNDKNSKKIDKINDIWHLERNNTEGAPWLIVGIEANINETVI